MRAIQDSTDSMHKRETAMQVAVHTHGQSDLARAFERVVRQRPGQAAVCVAAEKYSYDDINARANRLAHRLLDPDTLGIHTVGLLLDQGVNLIVSLLAVLKAGKCYIPIDPFLPEARVKHILAETGAGLLVTDDAHMPPAPSREGLGCALINLDSGLHEYSIGNPLRRLSKDEPAYIIYTSGSSGEPKGVMQSHSAVMQSTRTFARLFSVRAGERQSLLYTPGVFGSQRDTLLALLNGMTLYHYPVRDKGLNGLPQWLQDNEISILCSVATVFRNMLTELDADWVFDSVRLVKIGGEATYWRDVDSFYRHFRDDCRLFCGFSMSETNIVTSNFVSRNQPRVGETVSLGHPVDGKQIVLLGEDGKPVEQGPGEMAVRSQHNFIAYAGRPDLSAQLLSVDSEDARYTLFRTGDLAERASDGSYRFIGRKDRQVKVRGFRVDLMEIESAIRASEDVREVAVVAQEFGEAGNKLLAYLVFKPGSDCSTLAVRDALRATLPSHMVPAFFQPLRCLPQTRNGKLDRNSLPTLGRLHRDDPATFVAPANPLEDDLLSCWESCLGIVGVGTRDRFFDIGGDSLQATQLLLEISQRFDVEMTAEDILEDAASINGMAELIHQRRKQRLVAGLGDERTRLDVDFAEFGIGTAPGGLYYADRVSGLRRLTPNFDNGRVAVNSSGFRSPEIAVEKSPQTLRIAYLGSSATFDPFVSCNEATWVHQSQQVLAEQHPGKNLEYLNAAISGTSIDRLAVIYNHCVAAFKPDVAVICINDINQAAAGQARAEGLSSGQHYRKSRLAKRSLLYFKLEKNLLIAWRLLFAHNRRGKLNILPEDMLAESRDKLESLVELLREDGVDVVFIENGRRIRREQSRLQQLRAAASQVFFMPYLSISGFLDIQKQHIDILDRLCEKTDIPFYNLADEVPGEAAYYVDSAHFSDLGSRHFGRVFAEKFGASTLLAKKLAALPED